LPIKKSAADADIVAAERRSRMTDAQIEADERQEAAPAGKGLSGKQVKVRVLRRGHGKIFTGAHEGGEPTMHAHKDELALDRTIAEELEERGYVEIDEDHDVEA
jgi:hypothetical protein